MKTTDCIYNEEEEEEDGSCDGSESRDGGDD
jgi:hypothetical protein